MAMFRAFYYSHLTEEIILDSQKEKTRSNSGFSELIVQYSFLDQVASKNEEGVRKRVEDISRKGDLLDKYLEEVESLNWDQGSHSYVGNGKEFNIFKGSKLTFSIKIKPAPWDRRAIPLEDMFDLKKFDNFVLTGGY